MCGGPSAVGLSWRSRVKKNKRGYPLLLCQAGKKKAASDCKSCLLSRSTPSADESGENTVCIDKHDLKTQADIDLLCVSTL